MKPTVALLTTLLLAPLAALHAADAPTLLPPGWEPALAGDMVLQRLVKVSAPQVKGAHDAEFVCVGERAYIVEHDNDVEPGHGAGAAMYCVLTVVNLKTLEVEKTHLLAKAGQVFANVTLPNAQVFVPRIIRKDEHTLRTYFCSKSANEQTWYRDFDLRTESFEDSIHILYDWNRHTDAEILMAKFREEDVLAGKIVSKDAKLLMLANKATGPKPEKLYNGIELPDQWPPRFRDPNSAEPMEVPYLSNPPKVIPIDIGRQLFVDDFLIESTELKRVFHQATKFEGNPVFKAQTERELGASTQGERGEEATTFTGQGGVFYDPSEKLFKMFYVAGWRGPLSLATSPDMKTWTRRRPLLPEGLRWTGPKLESGGSDNCVWLDLNAKSPAERIKYLTCWLHVPKDQRPHGFMHSLHMSDGKTWTDAVTTSIAADDYCSFFYNPFREKWVFSIKKGTARGRSRYYFESDDFLNGADWKKSVYWTSTDRLDAPEPEGRYPGAGERPQLYSLNGVAYESLMVGMHYIHRGPNNEICAMGKFPKLTDLELGFSRDGFHWDRPDRSGFIKASRTEGSWDRGYLHGAAGVFVVLDDQLVFPYMGTSGIAPSGHRGMYTGGSIGLATLRRDGFASMEGTGSLTTRPLKFNGTHLFVNLKGEVRVEVLDEAGKLIRSSNVVSGDRTKLKIEWPEVGDLSGVAGKNVKFRFHLNQGSLYAFWVTSDENGASNGYVGAGGPAFNGLRDADILNERKK